MKPKRDRAALYRLGASGKLTGFLADRATCVGTVKVTAKKGKKAVAKRVKVKLGSGGCAYAASLKVTGAGRWKVTASFAGNGSLRARSAQARQFRAG